MKAAVITAQGLEVRDVPQPQPKPHEVLVRVRAAGLNRADLHMAGGQPHGPQGGVGATAGLEFAGEVVECGAEAQMFKPGDRVMGGGGGTFAEYTVADYGRTMPVPAGMSFEQASALPIGLNTLHDALVTQGRLKPGGTVLIQGASTSVGLIGLQIAKFQGARFVIGTSTNPERRERLREFGADLALDSRAADWAAQAVQATGGGVDVTVDMVSGYTVNQGLQAASVLGRIVNIGRLGGNSAEFDFETHSRKRIHYIGASFRTRSIEEIREIARLMREDLQDALAAGKLRIPVDSTFALADIAKAYAHSKANAAFGKVVVTI